jgi:cell division protein FtsA
LGITKVKIPRIGDEDTTSEVALDYIQTIIHARVEEILVLVKNKLKKSGILDNIGSGIVITGGLSNLDGIKKLATKVFEGIPISLSNPKNIKNGYMSFDEPSMSTIVGLLYYSLGTNRSYQLDSSKKLVRPIKKERIEQEKQTTTNPTYSQKSSSDNIKEQIEIKDNATVLTPLTKEKKKGVSRFWSKVSEWF